MRKVLGLIAVKTVQMYTSGGEGKMKITEYPFFKMMHKKEDFLKKIINKYFFRVVAGSSPGQHFFT